MHISKFTTSDGPSARVNPNAGGPGSSKVNYLLLIVTLLLLGIGLVTVYSAIQTSTEYSFVKQIVGVVLGIVVMVGFWIFDYRRFSEWFVPLMAISIVLILLPMVPGLGSTVNGAKSWVKLGSLAFQPSELAKPLIIMAFASFAARYKGSIMDGGNYMKALGVVLVPFVLIAKDDLGTGLVVFIVGLAILFVAGASRKWLLVTIMAIAVAIAGLLTLNGVVSDWSGGNIQLIKTYQMSRLLVFIDPNNADYSSDAYNLNQAKIAVGSGGFFGTGLGNATQATGGFLPEAATDFIFCVYAQQFGFFGAFILIGLYLALLATALGIGLRSSDLFGSLIVAGIMGMWLFQILENIGMDLGLMPITGIPLPFMSYGSSFMLTNFACVGLMLSIWSRRGAQAKRTGKAIV